MTADEFVTKVKSIKYFPQIAIGAQLTSSLVNHILIKYLNNEDIKYAPAVNCINSFPVNT